MEADTIQPEPSIQQSGSSGDRVAVHNDTYDVSEAALGDPLAKYYLDYRFLGTALVSCIGNSSLNHSLTTNCLMTEYVPWNQRIQCGLCHVCKCTFYHCCGCRPIEPTDLGLPVFHPSLKCFFSSYRATVRYFWPSMVLHRGCYRWIGCQHRRIYCPWCWSFDWSKLSQWDVLCSPNLFSYCYMRT